MNGTKSKGRGRSPKVPKFSDEKAPVNGSINGKPNEYSNISQQRVELSENIFLFYPNLIGMLITMISDKPTWSSLMLFRLLTHRPRYRVSLLHAPTSPNVLWPLQYLLPTRCSGWSGRPILSTVYPLRRCIGHGHRSLHNGMFVGVPELCLASMGSFIPRTD